MLKIYTANENVHLRCGRRWPGFPARGTSKCPRIRRGTLRRMSSLLRTWHPTSLPPIHACTYVCMNIYMYVWSRIYIHTYIYMCIYIHIKAQHSFCDGLSARKLASHYAYMYVCCLNVYIYVFTHTCTHTKAHTKRTHTYLYMYTPCSSSKQDHI